MKNPLLFLLMIVPFSALAQNKQGEVYEANPKRIGLMEKSIVD